MGYIQHLRSGGKHLKQTHKSTQHAKLMKKELEMLKKKYPSAQLRPRNSGFNVRCIHNEFGSCKKQGGALVPNKKTKVEGPRIIDSHALENVKSEYANVSTKTYKDRKTNKPTSMYKATVHETAVLKYWVVTENNRTGNITIFHLR
jgi:hypothetical protein